MERSNFKNKSQTSEKSVSLKVGTNVLKVNKSRIIAESDYFRGLFNHREQFLQDSVEVDLTKDVESITDLKLVIGFIESGKIDIVASTLRTLVTLSTFFGIPKLVKACIDFMLRTVNLKNVHRYHMYSAQYGLLKLRNTINSFVEPRFHDVLIHEEITANVPADELLFILHEGLLQHCSKESIFDFLLKWMDKKSELDETDLSVVIQVIEYFNKLESFHDPPFEGRFSRNVIKVEAVLKKHANISETHAQELRDLLVEFQQKLPSRTSVRKNVGISSKGYQQKPKEEISEGENADKPKLSVVEENRNQKTHVEVKPELKQLVSEVAPELEKEEHRKSKKIAEGDDHSKSEGMQNKMEKATGSQIKKEVPNKASGKVESVFTLSKRKYSELNIKEEYLKYLGLEEQIMGENTELDEEDVLFDLCVYDSVSRTWYHIATFDEETYLQQINDGYGNRVNEVGCSLYFFASEFLFSDKCNSYKLVKYNSNQKEWRRIDLLDKVFDYRNYDERTGNFSIVPMKNGALLMVAAYEKCKDFMGFLEGMKERSGVSFSGFLVNPKTLSIRFMFKTDTIPCVKVDPKNLLSKWSKLTVQYSAKSDEAIILYCNGVGLHAAYVVDLKPWEDHDKSRPLEGHDGSSLVQPQLLLHKVIDIDPVIDEGWFPEAEVLALEDRFIVLIIPCKYRAFELVVKYEYLYHSNTLKPVENGAHYEPDQEWGRGYGEPLRSSQDNTYWIMEDKNKCCHFKKVTFGTSTELPATEVHTPPPFCDAVAMYATKVNRTFFSKLKPVKYFLRKPAC